MTTYNESMIEADVFKMLLGCDMAKRTKDNYEFYLRNWFAWFYDRNPEGDPKDVDATDVSTWFGEHPHWKSATKHTAITALRKFYKYKWGDTHPICQIKVRRVDPGPQRTLDKNELMDVLSSLDTTSLTGIRDLAILSLMVDTGLRSNEVCNLEISRLDLKRQKLTVVVKGGGIQEKLFFDYTTSCLENWLAVRYKAACEGNRFVFCSIGGRNPGEQITHSALRYLSNKLARLSGIRHFSPHTMRRTFATLATENGAPTRVVQVAGGWKSIRMVERYTQALKPDAIKPYSPIDKLMN
jgi:site-specific recombinase XerD